MAPLVMCLGVELVSLVEWARLDDGVSVVEHGGMMSLAHPWGTLPLATTEPAIAEALRCLVERPVPVSMLDAMVDGRDPVLLARWYLVLDVVRGLFVHELRLGETRLLRSVPMAADAVHRRSTWPLDAVARLSRFTVVRQVAGATMADSHLSFRRAVLDSPQACRVVEELGCPVGREELAAAMPGMDAAVVQRIAEFLAACGLLRFVARPLDEPVEDPQDWDLHWAQGFWERRQVRPPNRCRQRPTWRWSAPTWPTCCRAIRR